MIKAKSISVENYKTGGVSDGREVLVSLVADTSAEVIAIGSDGSTVKGLNTGDTIVLGSTCLCTNGDFGLINSSGVWTF